MRLECAHSVKALLQLSPAGLDFTKKGASSQLSSLTSTEDLSTNILNASGADPDSAPNMSSSSVEFRSSDTAVVSSPQKKLERRGHTKSRRGCFNCKRRRIKIPIFTMEDMRFFQHFLLQCYPHHPLGNENVWTHEVPCLSQTHPYLMHAILGLAACELRKQDPSVLPQAMANALISACFALTFQSVLLEDGMPEYMAFIRGIVVVGMQMATRRIRPIFSNIMEEDASARCSPSWRSSPRCRARGSTAPSRASRTWRPSAGARLDGDRVPRAPARHGRHAAAVVVEGYQCMKAHYGWWIMLPHERFQLVVDRGSQVMVLLAAHWIALKQIMAEITLHEYDVRQKAPADRDHTEEACCAGCDT
ncbi:hypothetical protein EV126DRAFT_447134 [Verticillium dahliae]|nr:hypothetical protein EV126DRAFT_447134 [Verticillium dahliae]